MGKPRQRAVDILGLQRQSGRCGSRASGRTSKGAIANGGRPTASRGPFDSTISGKRSALFRKSVLAETEGHHPDISFGWGYANVSLNTKKIKGLHENDFIMASKIDRLLDRPDGFLDHKQ
jgi:hypothetical protein